MRGVDGSSRPARLRKELKPLLMHTSGTCSVREGGTARKGRKVPPREGHVFKTKARAPTLVLLETVDDPDADTTCLREEDSESDDDKPVRRMTPAQNHPVCLSVSSVFPIDGVTPSLRHLTPLPNAGENATPPPRRVTKRANALRERSEEHRGAPTDDDHSTTSADLAGEVNDEMLPTPSTSQELTGDQLKRVTSVPSIVECSYGADDAATGRRKAGGAVAAAWRNTSSTGLDTLAEADTPLDGEEPTPVPRSRRDAWIRRK